MRAARAVVAAASIALGICAVATHPAIYAVEPGTASGPASVNHRVSESDLLTVTLSPEAETRLGIELGAIARQPISRTRLYGGEVVAPPSMKGGEVGAVYPGGASGSLYQLADARITATARVEQLKAQLDGARAALTRAERMLESTSGSGRAVEEARTAVAVAEADYRAAVARRDLLGRRAGSAPGRVWIRTAVYATDVSGLRADAAVRVGRFDDTDASGLRPARQVDAPRSADPGAGTVDVFFEVDATDGRFQPGDKVKVIVPFDPPEEQLVVPWSAVVHDIYGGTWVYERVREHVFARRPVQVRAVVGDLAALKSAPPAGTQVVTVGAAELFGAEFGVPH